MINFELTSQPLRHWHWYFPIKSWQFPPFLQGFSKQSFSCMSCVNVSTFCWNNVTLRINLLINSLEIGEEAFIVSGTASLTVWRLLSFSSRVSSLSLYAAKVLSYSSVSMVALWAYNNSFIDESLKICAIFKELFVIFIVETDHFM